MPNFSIEDVIPKDFSKVIVVPAATKPDKYTIIALHGRGWAASRYRDLLFSTQIQGDLTLQQLLPSVKFVFPQAPMARATKYRRSLIPQWYDGTGDWEPEASGGMRAAIEHIHQLIHQEIELLQGDASKVILMGHSQGCATAITSLLLWEGKSLGGLIGTCGFIPLNAHMTAILDGATSDSNEEDDTDAIFFDTSADSEVPLVQKALDDLRAEAELLPRATPSQSAFPWQETPVNILHGKSDDQVAEEHGILAAQLLQKMEVTNVKFQSFEDTGHTVSREMLVAAAAFLHQLESSAKG